MNLVNNADLLEHGEARVLGTSACQQWLARLTAFENAYFGADFAWNVEQNAMWAASGAAFHAAVIRGAPEHYISASMSVLLASHESSDRLIAGGITECELVPWNQGRRCARPVLYFASVISGATSELPFLYGSLASDVGEYLDATGSQVTLGIAIASGDLGQRHLERNGFRLLPARYLDKYEFMSITAQQAKTPFWRRVLTEAADPLPSLVDESEISASSP